MYDELPKYRFIPRWRGEHRSLVNSSFSRSGLSPLARGTHAAAFSPVAVARFIPAGAGNTTRKLAGLPASSVYPRWRGEHFCPYLRLALFRGLSPLARGTRSVGLCVISFDRFIPAGAGNTVLAAEISSLYSVYPRWRGEHAAAIRGKTPWSVYPRWRGEHSSSGRVMSRQVGLSPLARGTLNRIPVMFPGIRFIPAGAGNTKACWLNIAARSVYPRWRGEHFLWIVTVNSPNGLSPLARGTPTQVKRHSYDPRFIPAGAGNTPGFTVKPRLIPVYPRWRGEHFSHSSSTSLARGLSPLARGTRMNISQRQLERRFIPAGAGNTVHG